MQSLQNLVDNAVVRREHHAPAQSHSDGRQQIRQEQQGAHGFLAPFQTVDKQRHHKADEHLKDHSKNGELDGVENRLLEIRVAQQLCIVLKGDKMRPVLQAAEKKKQELKSLQAQTKAATGIAVTVQELESMGKKSFTGNIVLTPDECRTLKNYAVSSFAEKAEKLKYQQKYETAKKDAGVWKKRYEKLLEQAQPYLDAVKLAPERVRAFLNAVLTRGKEKQDIPQERGRKRKESTIDR